MKNVLSLQVAGKHARQPRGGPNRHVSKISDQRPVERLKAENEQLRDSVVDLMLQIQALRDGELRGLERQSLDLLSEERYLSVLRRPQEWFYRSDSLLVTIGMSSGVPVGYLRSEILVVQSAQNWHRQRA
jgi:hypothetical protein